MSSKVNLLALENMLAIEFRYCVDDIIYNEKVQKLDNFEQHCHTSRLQHSINVAYYSFLICKFFGWDLCVQLQEQGYSMIYFYMIGVKQLCQRENHATWHPKVALDNARKICELNKIEEDAIRKHMWPCTLVPPKYKESFVVTLADKTCAIFEAFNGIIGKFLNR